MLTDDWIVIIDAWKDIPKPYKPVLVTVEDGFIKGVGYGFHNGQKWKVYASSELDDEIKVIAWKPLPEPYKGEDADD